MGVPWWGDPKLRTIPINTYDWKSSPARRIENFIDFSHFPWVHEGILGDRAKPLSPDHVVESDGETIKFQIALEEPQTSVKGDVVPGAKVQRDPTTYTVHLPYSVTLLVTWTLFLLIYWLLGIPLGLQAPYVYP